MSDSEANELLFRDPPNLCRTPQWEKRGAGSHFKSMPTALQPFSLAFVAPAPPPSPTSSLKPCCVTTRSTNTCCLPPEAHHMAFYCHTDAKKHHTEKQGAYTHTHTYIHIPCLWQLHFLSNGSGMFRRRKSNTASANALWMGNGLQINWRDL